MSRPFRALILVENLPVPFDRRVWLEATTLTRHGYEVSVICPKGKGFDKRRQWERTWDLQRLEDRGEPLPGGLERIPVPPKYAQADFARPSFWKARGKLDVPKERFVSVSGAERDADTSMVLAWAGFDHAQLAQAIATK